MKKFDVWLHPRNVGTCRVRVDGKDNTNWLLSRLSNAYIVKTRDSIRRDGDSPFYTFDVHYPPQFSHFMLEELLERIPTINLRMGFGMAPTRDGDDSA